MRVLFVCLGNICRSPAAEGIFRQLVRERGVEGLFQIDSAGTGDWHVGQGPDERSAAACLRVGVDIRAHRARQVQKADFDRFDWILAADYDNMSALEHLQPQGSKAHVGLLMRFAGNGEFGSYIPDPYYGGPEGFSHMIELIRAGCEGFLASALKEMESVGK